MRRIAYYVEGTRLLEWTASVPVVVLGIFLFEWPQMTQAPAFRFFVLALPPKLIGATLLICGVMSISALLINGASKEIGPRVRSWTALSRAVLMFQFGLSTIESSIGQGFPFTVQPYWFSFAIAELWVVYRAVLDVRPSH